ncbi:hypothetical protein AAK967_09140 [Atopobiaceae bacterium 24-176]
MDEDIRIRSLRVTVALEHFVEEVASDPRHATAESVEALPAIAAMLFTHYRRQDPDTWS